MLRDVARRGFLKRLGAVGVGATVMPNAAIKVGAESYGVAGLANEVGVSGESVWGKMGLSEKAWKVLRRDLYDRERQITERINFRVAGLDPDLYGRVSGAHWWRVRIQMRRDRTMRHRLEKLRRRVWPEDW